MPGKDRTQIGGFETMRVIFDITHPADVHLFKNVIRRFERDGHGVLVTTRDKDVTLRLLDELGIEHVCLSRMRPGLLHMGRELIERHLKMLALARRFRPDVLVARMGISIGPAGIIAGAPRIVVEDTEHARLQLAISLPFASRIVTGMGYLKDYGARQARFRGFPVMAYLAPGVFAPDPQVLRRWGVNAEDPYIVMRLVSWQAVHDLGVRGSSEGDIIAAVQRLSRFGRVLLSSEGALPEALRGYASPVPVSGMHHLLALARLCIGESATMAAEAAVLGTPAVVATPLRPGYLLALERDWGLLYNVNSLMDGCTLAERLLTEADLPEQWAARRQNLLENCEDASEFLANLILESARRRGRK
jgi:uncharacterized protein